MFTGFSIMALLVIPITWIHEALHIIGAKLLGGTIQEVVFFNPQAWVSNFIYPIETNVFGYVRATVPKHPLYYFIPYIVLGSIAIFSLVASVIDDDFDNLLFLAGPIIWSQYIFFWGDFQLYIGQEVAQPIILNLIVFFTALSITSYQIHMKTVKT